MQSRRTLATLALVALAGASAYWIAWLASESPPVREGQPLGAVPVVAEAPGSEAPPPDAPSSDPASGPASDPDLHEPGEPVAPESDQRQEVAPEEPQEPSAGTVHGRVANLADGTVVLAARGGALPLDCAAIAWAIEPGGDEPEPVRRTKVQGDGTFDLGTWSPGPLRLLFLAPTSSGVSRHERDDLWVLAGSTDLGGFHLDDGSQRLVRFAGPQGEPVFDAQLFLAPRRLSGPVLALGWAACSPVPLQRIRSPQDPVLATLPSGRSSVLAVAPGRAPTWIDVEPSSGDGDGLSIVLAPGASVSGELIDVDGLGLGGLRVGASALRGPRLDPTAARAAGVPAEVLLSYRTTKADDAGRFQFDSLGSDEALLLRAVGGDRLDISDAFAPEVVAFGGDTDVELERRRGAELAFAVRDGLTGEAIAPFRALLYSASDPDRVPRLARRFTRADALWSDIRPPRRAANPLFEDLPESEELTLWLEAAGFTGRAGPTFRLRTGERLELGTLQIAQRAACHVLVTDARSLAPIARARCELQPVSAFGPEPAIRARTGRDGRVQLAPALDLAHELYVSAPGYRPWRAKVAVGKSTSGAPQRVVLEPSGTLRVRVIDGEQRPLCAEVVRRRSGAELGPHQIEEYERALTDQEGVALFTELEPGLTSVAALALTRSDLERPIVAEALTWFSAGVSPGTTSELELFAAPALGLTLELTCKGQPVAGAIARLAPGRDAFRDPNLDATQLATWPTSSVSGGQAVFLNLPARDYSLRVEGSGVDGFGRAVVRLEPQSQVQQVELHRGWVAGTVVDVNGMRLPGARVVAWALGPLWDEELELQPRMTLEEIAPPPLVLGDATTDEEGRFALSGPEGVQVVITAHDREHGLVGDYWLEELPTERDEDDAIVLVTAPGTRMRVRLLRKTGEEGPRSPGVVALYLDQPWGRGVIAQPMTNDELVIDDVPPGRWKICAVELSQRSVIVEASAWGWVDAFPQDEPLWLPWNP